MVELGVVRLTGVFGVVADVGVVVDARFLGNVEVCFAFRLACRRCRSLPLRASIEFKSVSESVKSG